MVAVRCQLNRCPPPQVMKRDGHRSLWVSLRATVISGRGRSQLTACVQQGNEECHAEHAGDEDRDWLGSTLVPDGNECLDEDHEADDEQGNGKCLEYHDTPCLDG